MHLLKGFYHGLVIAGNGLQPVILLLIRLFLGFAFYQAGVGKFANIGDFEAFLTSLSIPLPHFHAYFVAGVEAVGGALLMLGLGSRLAGLLLTINMVVAYLTTHFDAVLTLWSDPNMFASQQPFLYLVFSCFIFAFGPGLFSLDALLKRFVWKQ